MDSRTIYVDDEVYAFINQRKHGQRDTASDVVRRMIGLSTEPRGRCSPAVATVLAVLRDAQGDVTAADVADTTGVARSTTRAALVTLERDELARRRGGQREGCHGRAFDWWSPVEPNSD